MLLPIFRLSIKTENVMIVQYYELRAGYDEVRGINSRQIVAASLQPLYSNNLLLPWHLYVSDRPRDMALNRCYSCSVSPDPTQQLTIGRFGVDHQHPIYQWKAS